MIIDDFLPDFDAMRTHADMVKFGDYVNPADGVVYPHISVDIPDSVLDHIESYMGAVMGREPNHATVFMRASPAGVEAPHKAHSDHLMGDYSLMLYLNRAEHCQGGTALVRHKATGVDDGYQAAAMHDVWARDTNSPEAWDILDVAEMRPNRAFIFDAARMHMALPTAGFGSTPADQRLVLTGFFS